MRELSKTESKNQIQPKVIELISYDDQIGREPTPLRDVIKKIGEAFTENEKPILLEAQAHGDNGLLEINTGNGPFTSVGNLIKTTTQNLDRKNNSTPIFYFISACEVGSGVQRSDKTKKPVKSLSDDSYLKEMKLSASDIAIIRRDGNYHEEAIRNELGQNDLAILNGGRYGIASFHVNLLAKKIVDKNILQILFDRTLFPLTFKIVAGGDDSPYHKSGAAKIKKLAEKFLDTTTLLDGKYKFKEGLTIESAQEEVKILIEQRIGDLEEFLKAKYPEDASYIDILKRDALATLNEPDFMSNYLSEALITEAAKGNMSADTAHAVNFLILCGVNVNGEDTQALKPLHIACSLPEECSTLINILLDNGADINILDQRDRTPLHIACIYNNQEAIRILLSQEKDRAINVNSTDEQNHTPLHFACMKGNLQAAVLMIENSKELNVNAKNKEGWTPLHFACESAPMLGDHLKIVRFLLENDNHFTDPDIRDNEGRTPLFVACKMGNAKAVELLLDARATIDIGDINGQTPMDVADDPKIIKLLEEHQEYLNQTAPSSRPSSPFSRSSNSSESDLER